jgi:ABC-type oligopeptide transport system substrate-binding subunit
VSPEYDRLCQAYTTTLDPDERIQRIAEMEHALNEDVGAIPHFFTTVVTAHTAQLAGPVARMDPDAPLTIYNIERWTWQS